MAYGENMKRLSPCSDELIADTVYSFCGEPASLLDVGCGRGERLAFLAKRFPGARLFGVDIDGENAAVAKAAVAGGDIRICGAEKLPFEDESMELVLCECSLSLFSERERCVKEMHRVLKTGGSLVLADIYTDIEAENTAAADGSCVGSIPLRKELEDLLYRSGFSLRWFSDRRDELTAMAAQMIFDGSFCGSVGMETAKMLKRLKAGYGLWIYEKEEI